MWILSRCGCGMVTGIRENIRSRATGSGFSEALVGTPGRDRPEWSPLIEFSCQSKVRGPSERMLHHPAGNLSLTNRHQSQLREGQSSWASVGWSLPLAVAVRTAKPRAPKVGTDPRPEERYRCHDLRHSAGTPPPSLLLAFGSLPSRKHVYQS